MLDEEKISFNPAVEIIFLKEEEQKWMLEAIEYTLCVPSLSHNLEVRYCEQKFAVPDPKVEKVL